MKWLRIFSPCFIAMILSLIVVVYSLFSLGHSGGWSIFAIWIFLTVAGILFIADMLIKMAIRNTGHLWLMQAILLSLSLMAFFLIKH